MLENLFSLSANHDKCNLNFMSLNYQATYNILSLSIIVCEQSKQTSLNYCCGWRQILEQVSESKNFGEKWDAFDLVNTKT